MSLTESAPLPANTLAPVPEPWDDDEFARLVMEWKATRGHTSSAAKMARNPAYQQIIEKGRAAIPRILSELRREPDHWFIALNALTGADPVPPESRGRIDAMTAAWLAWGKANGYIN